MKAGEKELPERPTAADFDQFFRDVHHHEPFPWQKDLLARVHGRGWPALIDVPTGLGKTAVLDVAVFLSAMRSEHARRRVFLVVDRRIIVDQAHANAELLRQALKSPEPGSVRERVRASLAVPGDEGDSPLDVTRMRGGVDWSWLWVERPDRHAIVTGTVDQVGSRLLFRGYGVGERLRPIDAAMVGTDSLIIIDEAHLSDPFFTTLKHALAFDCGGVGRPPLVVAMSASPQSSGSEIHRITDADVQHPVAGKRLRAPKSLHPVAVTATAAAAPTAVADALAQWARHLGGQGKVIGVVANTVRMARAVFERLRSEADDPDSCVLLTGRVRPIDREYLLDSWYSKIKSGAVRDPQAELYVVATQTIEAGADIDLDGMVTQTSSLSALVQRLGRVNRMGSQASAPVVVVHCDKLPSPVYGAAAEQMWTWLAELAEPHSHKAGRPSGDLGSGIPASPAQIRELIDGIPASQQALMQVASAYVPALNQPTLDAWARTSPAPHPDAPVGPYLHGIDAGEPTVSVIWRADLAGDEPANWLRSVELIPPSADEALELPISAVRRWLRDHPLGNPSGARPVPPSLSADTASDLESQGLPAPEDGATQGRTGLRVLRYRGTEDSAAGAARDLRSGDFVIVPSCWGGCDRYGWHPESRAAVADVADFTGWRPRRTAAIRVGPTLPAAVQHLAPELLEQVRNLIDLVKADIDNESAEEREYRQALEGMSVGWDTPQLPHELVLSKLAVRGRLAEIDRDERVEDRDSRPAALLVAVDASWNEDGSASGSSGSREQQTLATHQDAVAKRAREFADHLGLPEALARAVEYAARHHDEGKRDERFQAMLRGGDRLRARAMADQLLAKSGMNPADKAAFRRATQLSGYPSKMRHEALSARITVAKLENEPANLDRDLVVHLVAAHHGFARPLLPPIVDEEPVKVTVPLADGQMAVFDTAETVDWAGPERFQRLCGRYGRWGLALLESIVRLADMWCSARSEGCDDDHS